MRGGSARHPLPRTGQYVQSMSLHANWAGVRPTILQHRDFEVDFRRHATSGLWRGYEAVGSRCGMGHKLIGKELPCIEAKERAMPMPAPHQSCLYSPKTALQAERQPDNTRLNIQNPKTTATTHRPSLLWVLFSLSLSLAFAPLLLVPAGQLCLTPPHGVPIICHMGMSSAMRSPHSRTP